MSFYKSIGLKHFEDLENYIKKKEWLDTAESWDPFDTANSLWTVSNNRVQEDFFINSEVVWSIKNIGSRWSIQEIFTLHGSRAYNSIDITEKMVELYNAMIEKKPIYIQIEKDITNEVFKGRRVSGTLLAQTKVKVVDPPKDTHALPWDDFGAGDNIILEDEFSTHVKYKRNIYSMELETDDQIRDKHQQWKYASRYGRR